MRSEKKIREVLEIAKRNLEENLKAGDKKAAEVDADFVRCLKWVLEEEK